MGALEAARAALQSFSERPVRQNAKNPFRPKELNFGRKGLLRPKFLLTVMEKNAVIRP